MGAILDKASLIVTPNAVKASKLYSAIPNDGTGDMTVVRATTATRVNASGLIETSALNVPRLDYTNATCPNILIESQTTNLFSKSEEFNHSSWSKENSTVFVNNTISPNNTLTADKIVEASNLNYHGVVRTITTTKSSIYTVSVFAKKDNNRYFYIGNYNGLSNATYFIFDFDTKTIVSSQNVGEITTISTKVIELTNGWFRLSLTYVNNFSSGNNFLFALSDVPSLPISNLYPIYLGNGTNAVFLWGAQLELSANNTSYIPTTTNSVTRNADVISKTSATDLIGQTQGTIFAEIKVNKLLGVASRYIFHLSDGTANNRIYMAFSGASLNVLRSRIFSGGTLQCSIDTSTLTETGTYKLAMAYSNNDVVFYVNGVQIGTDTTATIPTCNTIHIGSNYAGVSQINDGINSALIFKTRLTNTELQQLTTI